MWLLTGANVSIATVRKSHYDFLSSDSPRTCLSGYGVTYILLASYTLAILILPFGTNREIGLLVQNWFAFEEFDEIETRIFRCGSGDLAPVGGGGEGNLAKGPMLGYTQN